MTLAGRRVRWPIVYLLLLVLSALSQWLIWPGFGDPASYGPQKIVSIVGHDQLPLRIAYHQYGPDDAPQTIIALHGSPTLGEDFHRLGPILGKQFRVLAPLMPGYGDSTPFTDDYGITACADDVRGFMDAMHIPRAHLIGYSFGGAVAIKLTDEIPDRVQSLILVSALGVQEHEGTGDYNFEHLKYIMGYGLFVIGPELVPHFGLLGDRAVRHAFICNFLDSDQRPIRDTLKRLNDPDRNIPVLILHGRSDPLVPVAAAREHHELIKRSRLVTFPGGHILLFTQKGAQEFAEQIMPFIDQISDPDAPPFVRSTVDEIKPGTGGENQLFRQLRLEEHHDPWWRMAAIAAATFVSEDLTCISVGLLVNAGRLDLFVGIFGCFFGIFAGDVGLWLIGHVLGRRVLKWKPLARRLPAKRIEGLTQWFDRYGFVAVFASRFMPGTRMPLYIGAGVIGGKSKRFIVWALFAAMFYTPIIVLVVAIAGDVVAGPLHRFLGSGWLSLLVTALIILLAIRLTTALSTPIGRYRLLARIQRLWRWEFWPGWLFYLPLVPVYCWLALRYRGFGVFTAADPIYDDGGIVGESKWKILSQLQGEPIAQTILIPRGAGVSALADLVYPQIFKPDVGQRGAGVKKIDSLELANAYLADCDYDVIAQSYHPGPNEAGIFYYRMPDEDRGRIFSITDKHFPFITGDGKHTLEQLIWRHPRFRMQAATFLKRLGEDRTLVLAKDQTRRLAVAGNHCQGTMFLDGGHLKTDALERAIDRIAHRIDGFYFGRFDVRYADADQLKAGHGFAIIEVNAISSESTNLYDPRKSLLSAYRTLAKQWHLAFAIGSANKALGHKPITGLQILRRLVRYYRQRDIDLLSD